MIGRLWSMSVVFDPSDWVLIVLLEYVALLRKHGAHVRATDLKPPPGVPQALENLGVPFAPQSGEVFEGASLIVLSPGVPADARLPSLQHRRRAHGP